ncbi:uncharacterized protein LODBEIA_P20040 [Lodderomyces beijingensis]|uniref:DNA replication complex GINS protein SLD5 n=1 Tax=Lodderomyces beijingensis TaxID=1775926 RepID=A0ABP0ZI11_9ASCO
MDIDDILREFEESSNKQNELASTTNIAQELTTAMMNERMAPELLPYKSSLMKSILTHITNQQQFLLDSHEYGDMNSSNGVISDDFKLRLMIIETDVERTSYLVRLYLRTRLTKLNKFTLYYINESHKENDTDGDNSAAATARATATTTSGGASMLLSPEEKDYIHQYMHLLTQLYNNCFLKKLPKFLTLLDDNVGGQNMTIAPELDSLVFVKCTSDIPIAVQLDDDEIDMEKNGVYVVKYRFIRSLLATEDVVLI